MPNRFDDPELARALSRFRTSVEPSAEQVASLWSEIEAAGFADTAPDDADSASGQDDGPTQAAPLVNVSSGTTAKLVIAGLAVAAVIGTGVAGYVADDGIDATDTEAPAERPRPRARPDAVPPPHFTDRDSSGVAPESVPTSVHAGKLEGSGASIDASVRPPPSPTTAIAEASSPRKRREAQPRNNRSDPPGTSAKPAKTPARDISVPLARAEDPVTALREEARSLARIDAALRLKSFERAERLFDRHRREFPDGQLDVEAAGLAAVVRCRLDQPNAKADARRELDERPDSKLVWRIRRACGLR